MSDRLKDKPAREEAGRTDPARANTGGPNAIDAAHAALMRRAELIISYVLRGGVLVSAGIIALGVLLFYWRYLAVGGRGKLPTYPHTLPAVLTGTAHGDPVAIIALGLLVLLLTPVLRVLVSVVTFALERDRLYTAITVVVFLILVISFLLGRGGA